MDELIGNFTTVSITRERYEELVIEEENCYRLKKLIQQKLNRFEGIAYTELKLIGEFLGVDVPELFSLKESEGE